MDYNFVEVMQNFDRMCHQYDYACDVNECPIAALIDKWEKENNEIWTRDCAYYGSKYPKEFAEAVMQWVSTHPTPIYPRVVEVIDKITQLMGIDTEVYNLSDIMDMPLTEAAANYFGIEPINKDKLA